ncbi:tetratricopeptide repeat protein [Actinokineospora inagensis]|uniref:tetratricopeptide repeat protein n=1 Tax=Actinokineospora inagensis TaxID=103730 RepID=UPI00041E54F2|nr:tetratricopeptide repeat protein [Actinokineospora inagensis]
MADPEEPDRARTHDRLSRRLQSADDLPASAVKCEALERVARAADTEGLVDLGVAARLVLINAYREIRRYDLMLTPFAWLRATETRQPEAFDDWAVHQFTWMHKWLPTGLLGDPRFTLGQITALVDQLDQRYRLHGYSPHPVHDKRRAVAHHIGDTAAADGHFAAWRAAEPDEMSDCPACVVDSQVGYFVSRRRFDEAIAVAQPVLTEPSDCAEQPHGVLASLIEAYLATGRLADAARAHLVSYRVVRGTPQGRSALHAHLRFCAITDNAGRGMEILADNLDVLAEPPSPKVLQEFAAAAALLLSRVPDRAERVFTVGERVFDGEALRRFCAERAVATAAEFDRRNGTDAVSHRVRRTLDLPDVAPVLVAVPAPRPVEAAAPGAAVKTDAVTTAGTVAVDPVAAAGAACAEMERGQLLTGTRLLGGVPLDADLPEPLATMVAVYRDVFGRCPDPVASAERIVAHRERLLAVGATRDAAGLHHPLSGMYRMADHPAQAMDHARLAIIEGAAVDRPDVVVGGHLAVAELLGPTDPAGALAAVDAAEDLATSARPRALGTVRMCRANLLAAGGDLAGALAMVEGLLDGVEDWSESTELRLTGHRARLLAGLGRGEEAIAWFEELVTRCRAVPGPWLADSLLQYAAFVDQAGLAGERMRVLLDAAAATRQWLYPASSAKACLYLSSGYLSTGRDLEAAETLEEALRLAPASAEGLVRDIRYALAVTCRRLGEDESAERHFRAVVATSADPAFLGHVLHQIGEILLERDDLVGAAAVFADAVDRWRVAGHPVAASESMVRLAHARGLLDLADGLSCLDEAAAMVADTPVDGALDQLADVTGFRAALLAHHERYEEALAVNATAEEYAVRLGNADWHAFLAGRAARLHLDLGNTTAAEAEARRAAALLGADTDGQTVGAVLGSLARALEEQGKPVEADPLIKDLTNRLE